jgi:uridine kinase
LVAVVIVAGIDAMSQVQEMRVGAKKGSGLYIRTARSFLKGLEPKEAEGDRPGIEAKAPVDELNISGLGDAIVATVTVARQMEAEGLGTIERIETNYPEMPGGRSCAQISVLVKRIKAVTSPKPVVVVGITGCSRSGKSWVAKELRSLLGSCQIVGQDAYWARMCQVTVDGKQVSSEEEPECTDHDAFASAIANASAAAAKSFDGSKSSFVIAEGFQLVFDKKVADMLDYIFLLDIGREDCIARRSAPRNVHNGNPLSPWACEHLLWPAHERYLRDCVEPLGEKVRRFEGPNTAEDTAALAATIADISGLQS